ncbi:allantoinase PuuE [Ancylobacter sp. A5.8]|uniref:allantoinase PuuE n=1 Tax=Ancylobacter gelatini TaxID=2919920 RepID=UPI001F4EF702|nr:allantoinase PuuE [Ancylobacter gelatini]MCJ8143915.1 allantoinase PuuE [Ancylobacter gelatini]
MQSYPRDLIGYGPNPVNPHWPGDARVAVSFVLNYEEGGEYSILHGDPHSETVLTDLDSPPAMFGERHLNVESNFEYGSRVGFWEILRLFRERNLPLTIYAVGMALERNPQVAAAIREAGYEVAGHGYRWIDYHTVSEEDERADIKRCIRVIEEMTGTRPVGWYTGRPSINTRRLLVEEGGFLYDCDSYSDDVPYWTTEHGRPHLIVPYSLDNNDSRMTRAQGFDLGEHFYTYVRDSFDWLHRRGAVMPRMMSVGLHNRLIGRPGRIGALERLLDHMMAHEAVWFAGRAQIARHWIAQHPFTAQAA